MTTSNLNRYEVTITATITKTLTVTAAHEDQAAELAHEMFSVVYDGTEEDYDEQAVKVEKIGD